MFGSARLSLDVISRYRAGVYGFAIVWIVLFHADAINGVDYSFGQEALRPLAAFLAAGNVGVDVFLFLSGVCLYFSFVRNPDYQSFIVKRLRRVVLPVMLVYVPYWFVRYIVLNFMPTKFFSRLTLMQFLITGDQTIWFITLILILYVLYPYIYWIMFCAGSGKKRPLRCILLIALSYAFALLVSISNAELYDMVEIALTRVPVFLIGCAFGPLVYEKKTVSIAWVIAAFAVFTGFIFIANSGYIESGILNRFIYGIGGVAGCYVIALIFGFFDKLPYAEKRLVDDSGEPLVRRCSWPIRAFASTARGVLRTLEKPGMFSLELYCAHIMLNQAYRMTPFFDKGNLCEYLIVAAASFVLAWLVKKVSDSILLKYDRRRLATSG